MKPLPPRLVLAAALSLAAGCSGGSHASGPGDAASGSAAATPTPQPTASAVPIHVRAGRLGKRYIEFTETSAQNRTVYTLQADSQTGQRDPDGSGTSAFVNPRIRFFATDGKVLYARSPAGTVTERANVVTVQMSGRVHAHTADGTALESDTLLYDDAGRTIHARGNVVLTTATERLQGGALDADLRLSHVHLTPGD